MATTKFRYGKNDDRWGVRYGSRAKSSNGGRPKICLGKVPEATADVWVGRVDTLDGMVQHGQSLGSDMLGWLAGLADADHEKLAEAFPTHVAARQPVVGMTLGEFLTGYLATLSGLAPSSQANYKYAARDLDWHFGESTPLSEIATADGEAFREFLASKHARSTVKLKMTQCRDILRTAVRQDHMQSSPLDGVRVRGRREKKTAAYTSQREIVRVLASCSLEWQVVFALARFAGLRCPSEMMFLEWSWFDWENKRFRVWDWKRRQFRELPIFTSPPLWPYLRRARAVATSDTKYVVNGAFGTRTADDLRQKVIDASDGWNGIHTTSVRWNSLRITSLACNAFKRAGGHPPSDLFRAMRKDASKDVRHLYGATSESHWIGHDKKTADDYYAEVRPDDWAAAASGPGGTEDEISNRGPNRGPQDPISDDTGEQQPEVASTEPLVVVGECVLVGADGDLLTSTLRSSTCGG